MRSLISIFVLLMGAILADGQVYTGEESEQIVKGASKVKVNENSGQIEYFEFSSQSLKSGLVVNGSTLSQKVGLPNIYKLNLSNEFKDKQGDAHSKYQLSLLGIPVEGMGYTVHYKNGMARSVNGKAVKGEAVTTQAQLSESEAVEKAISIFSSELFIWDNDNSFYPKAQLLFVPHNKELMLCYKVDVYSLKPLQREYIYVDANTGDIVKRISRIHNIDFEGTAISFYNGTVGIKTSEGYGGYILSEHERGNGIHTYNLNYGQLYSEAVEFVDEDNYWHNPDDQVAYDAHFGAEMTYDYLFNKFGRNSIDGNGLALKSYVHFGNNYANAFWDGDRMTYGDGDGSSKYAFTSLDIVGHEIVHGLTSHSADLEYAYESGALNESFSDIFGVAIDFYVYPTSANYLIGEQVFIDGVSYLRNISDPNAAFHPDTYQGKYWITGTQDHGGVHSNSTVQSYWFYLLCEGGSGVNDNGDSYMVEPIGLEAAEAIAYRNLTVYLNRYSNFEDARFYSIQSAVDLYGECSNEVIQVTNAWYAVGVGPEFETAVTATFYSDQTFYCSAPASVQLNNTSTNADGYKWYLNNVEVSTEQNPILNIASVGEYSIKLEVTGTSECNSSDITEIENYITVANQATPIFPVNAPFTENGGTGGIYSVQLNELNNRSQGSNQGYEDFTCGHETVLKEGKKYSLAIRTGEDFKEAVNVWLDVNNDGIFSNQDEKIYTSIATEIHKGEVKIPAGVSFGDPLRLRIGSDRYDYASELDGINDSQYGQYEDYTVILEKNTAPPLANFSVSDTIAFIHESVSFFDKSENVATSRIWHFEGGVPEYSSDPYPTVTYHQDGVYHVELMVANEFGSSSVSREIRVATNHLMGVHTQTDLSSGYIFDAGGEDGDYENSTEQTFLIAPYCAKEILLTIQELNTEWCCDILNIYDGADENGLLLASLKGTVSDPMLIKATSGSMFLSFTTNETNSYEGFSASWESVAYGVGNDVVADFNIVDEILPVNYELKFEDNSLYQPKIWNWEFGDGSTSNDQHPKYAFSTSGVHEVRLTVDNCISKDTITKQVVIEAEPELSVMNDTIRLNLLSGELVDSFISIGNLNNGLLAYEGKLLDSYEKGSNHNPIKYYSFEPNFEGIRVGLAKNVLYYHELKNTLTSYGAICLSVTSENISTSLNSLDVLIVDDSANFLDIRKNEIRDWVSKGGFLIIQGDGRITDFNNLLDGWGISYVSVPAKEGDAVLLNHEINEDLNAYRIRVNADCTLSVNAPATQLLNDANGNCYAALSSSGKGKILTMGDESFLYMSTEGHRQFLMNALEYSITPLNTALCELDPGYMFVSGQDTDSLKYKIDSNGLAEGQYVVDIQVLSNDVDAGAVNIPLLLNVVGIENIETDVATVDFGDVLMDNEATSVFKIKNSGTRNLTINSLSSSNEAFSVVYSPVEIEPGEIQLFDVKFTPTQLIQYNGTIEIHSSDPDTPTLTITLDGDTYTAPIVSNPIADKVIYLTYKEGIDLNEVFTDADNDVLTFDVTSSDNSIALPSFESGSVFKINPLNEGYVNITVTATDTHQALVSHSFNVQVKKNNSPTCPVEIADVFMNINDPAIVIDLSNHFNDMDGDVLSYTCLLSEEGVVMQEVEGGLLEITPLSQGTVQLSITAADGYGGEESHIFNASVGVSTDISKTGSNKLVHMYPNPVSSVLYIETNIQDADIQVFDTNGNRLAVDITLHLHKAQVDVSHLMRGIYIVKVISDHAEFVNKVIKY
ncbi:M4 family metallopeptidase [Saccharicrinis sp. GN24d3]|uniref:M4 family metallopeptidase n=1 Tax=Saccharicrinis sp. GN24d3 TaxID=3458416 RepID=UPI004036953B